MSKKKKKPSDHKKIKLASAQYRNEFFRKFRYIFSLYCDEKLYHQIPQATLDKIFEQRGHALHPVAAKGCKFSVSFMAHIKTILTVILKEEYIDLGVNDKTISLYDFYTVGISILRFLKSMNDDDFKGAKTIKDGLEKFQLSENQDYIIREKLLGILYSIGSINSVIDKCLYWLKYELFDNDNPLAGAQNLVYVSSHLPTVIDIEINGSKRPAVLLEWAFAQVGLECVSVKGSQLNIKSPSEEISMKVCFQKHALMRLAERIDSFYLSFVHLNVYLSFDDIRIFYDQNKNLLIEYRILDCRAGYFRVDIVDGMLVVRTFLFITNNSTPEGQLLEKNTGLQKLDKKYLAIDKLSTFMTSDIGNNEVLRKIFDESGCHSLIELHAKLDKFATKHSNNSIANLMLNYLGYDNA